MRNTLQRRQFLAGLGASLLLPGCGEEPADLNLLSPVDSDFPYPLFTAPARNALEAWEHLSKQIEGDASAVILGENSPSSLGTWAREITRPDERPIDEVIAAAVGLDFPQGYREHKRAERDRYIAWLRVKPENEDFANQIEARGHMPDGPDLVPIGEWPGSVGPSPGLTVGRSEDEVVLAAVPTTDWTEVPAYLRFGFGWEEYPPLEWHIAILRHWRERHDIELVGIDGGSMDLRVGAPPTTRERAIELAQEHFDYTSTVMYDMGYIATLAAHLMEWDWWHFWWDGITYY